MPVTRFVIWRNRFATPAHLLCLIRWHLGSDGGCRHIRLKSTAEIKLSKFPVSERSMEKRQQLAGGLIITPAQRITMDLKIQDGGERGFRELGAKSLYLRRDRRLLGQAGLQAAWRRYCELESWRRKLVS